MTHSAEGEKGERDTHTHTIHTHTHTHTHTDALNSGKMCLSPAMTLHLLRQEMSTTALGHVKLDLVQGSLGRVLLSMLYGDIYATGVCVDHCADVWCDLWPGGLYTIEHFD